MTTVIDTGTCDLVHIDSDGKVHHKNVYKMKSNHIKTQTYCYNKNGSYVLNNIIAMFIKSLSKYIIRRYAKTVC